MGVVDFLKPSQEKVFFLLLIFAAANFPFLGTYHREQTNTLCVGKLLTDCRQVAQREMLLNPIFWAPYIYSSGSEVLANTTGGDDDLRLPVLELTKVALPVPWALSILYWYIGACLIVYPFSKTQEESPLGVSVNYDVKP